MNEKLTTPVKDLVVLAADKNMEATIRGLLERPAALGIRSVSADVFVHPYRDPGVVHGAHEFLAPFIARYSHALVMFDRQGCGREESAEDVRKEVQCRLDAVGWMDRSAVIVLDPELEIWVWSNSPHVPKTLGMSSADLESLVSKYRPKGQVKPNRPKEAMEEALLYSRIPRSSSIYSQLAHRVGVKRCTDPVFLSLKAYLQQWFPSEGT